jgi:D-alanyl-D-alanine carboxypeptidase (penicillin-binding protein 5/6)
MARPTPKPFRNPGKAAAGLLLLLLIPTATTAQPFDTDVEHVLLLDHGTGTLLFQRNADQPMPPASLAKLMTLAVTFDALAAGQITLDTGFRISNNAWRKGGAASGASTMFAAQGSTIRVADLLRGVIVQSGNDAAIAIAEGIAGSEAAFAERMNTEAARIGLTGSHFVNPTGLPEAGQFVTARDMAILAIYILDTHPEFLPIFNEREFTWSEITQRNRNPLLGLDIGVDGMGTGYTEEAGYGLVATALRDGRRLIAVLGGAASEAERSDVARRLIEWGYSAFEMTTVFQAGEILGEAALFGGETATVGIRIERDFELLLPTTEIGRVVARIVYNAPVPVPVAEGAEIGYVQILLDGQELARRPVHADRSVAIGPLLNRAGDAFTNLMNRLW